MFLPLGCPDTGVGVAGIPKSNPDLELKLKENPPLASGALEPASGEEGPNAKPPLAAAGALLDEPTTLNVFGTEVEAGAPKGVGTEVGTGKVWAGALILKGFCTEVGFATPKLKAEDEGVVSFRLVLVSSA